MAGGGREEASEHRASWSRRENETEKRRTGIRSGEDHVYVASEECTTRSLVLWRQSCPRLLRWTRHPCSVISVRTPPLLSVPLCLSLSLSFLFAPFPSPYLSLSFLLSPLPVRHCNIFSPCDYYPPSLPLPAISFSVFHPPVDRHTHRFHHLCTLFPSPVPLVRDSFPPLLCFSVDLSPHPLLLPSSWQRSLTLPPLARIGPSYTSAFRGACFRDPHSHFRRKVNCWVMNRWADEPSSPPPPSPPPPPPPPHTNVQKEVTAGEVRPAPSAERYPVCRILVAIASCEERARRCFGIVYRTIVTTCPSGRYDSPRVCTTTMQTFP